MRRGLFRAEHAEAGASSPAHPLTHQRPSSSTRATLVDRVCSAPILLKLAVAFSLGWVLHAIIFFSEKEGQQVSHAIAEAPVNPTTTVVTVKEDREAARNHRTRKQSFRQLNMIGFENDQEGSEWKTCKEFREEELPPHKKEGSAGYDNFLQKVKPTPGASWKLEMTEDQDAEWLGLHGWDDRYEHGSEEAERRVKKLGYCRIHMPSIPRTGSTWFRGMFETATQQPTFAMWPEGGTFKEKYTAFSSDDPCGASLDHMEGNMQSTKLFPCRNVKPPNATSPIMFKSHTPFFPSYNKPSLMPEDTCMLVLLVRNPIDNHAAWERYMAKGAQILRNYLPVWQGHLTHWVAAAGDIPIYIFRYEDMLYKTEDMLRKMLQSLPVGWNWSEETIATSMRLYGPKISFESKCGVGITNLSVAEVEMVRRHYGELLRHFGYRFVKT